MTTILLIRHGQTDWNVRGRWQGHTDVPLNETGRRQARALAQRLVDWPIQSLYSSDLTRATMTAQILGQTLGLEPIHEPAWRERFGGQFEGLTGAEIQVGFPDAWAELQTGIVDPPGGENNQALRQRAASAFQQVVERHTGEMVAVVGHGGILKSLICHVLGVPVARYGRLSLRGNTGLSIIEIRERGPRLVLLNDTCHLDQSGSRIVR